MSRRSARIRAALDGATLSCVGGYTLKVLHLAGEGLQGSLGRSGCHAEGVEGGGGTLAVQHQLGRQRLLSRNLAGGQYHRHARRGGGDDHACDGVA